jgi:hypothetical protein
MGGRLVTPTFYKNNFFTNIEVHIGCITICRAYEKPSKNNIAEGVLHAMAYYIFLKSLRSLEEFRKNRHIKIPPKSLCTNFQSLGIFKNPIFILKRIFLQISAQSAQPPAYLFSLSAHAAFLAPSLHRPRDTSSSSRAAMPWTPPPPSLVPWSPQ